jgi:hypothetical protein
MGPEEKQIDFRCEISDLRFSRLQYSTFNKPHVSRTRALLGLLDGELHPLAFAKQLEHRAPNGAAMKEVLQAGFITNESEALVD